MAAVSAAEANLGDGTPMKNISDLIADVMRKIADAEGGVARQKERVAHVSATGGDTALLLSVLQAMLQELKQ